jgi:NAD(P)-dependent dehydrogenase (short-subunit alcohol dehydrogenase family)
MDQVQSSSLNLIVGASGGLGRAISLRVARTGAPLLLTYRTKRVDFDEYVQALTAKGANVSCCWVDLLDPASIETAVTMALNCGAIKNVVYSAGPAIPQIYLSATSQADWQTYVETEARGFFNLLRCTLPHLRESRGSLVATTTFALGRVIPGDVLSAVPKSMIEMLVRHVAKEEGRFGVRANCVAPGVINAGLGLKAQQEYYTQTIWEAKRKAVPLQRFGTAEEVASAVNFLLSDEASYITGQTITVDGGFSL